MARGKPLTHIQIDKALSFVALGHTLSQIADEIGCHPTALNRVLLEDYSEEYEAAKDRKRDKLRKIQWDVGTDPEHKDFRFFHDKLSLVHLPEYRDAINQKQQVEVSGPDGAPVQIEGRRAVSLADVFELAQRLGALPPDAGLGSARAAIPATTDILATPSADGDEPGG